ncbi:hypothetical protein N9W21_04065 [Shewanella sp.]|nr:hypothetical protein [Shewanella sp.]
MAFHLALSLTNHRRGRFFSSLIVAEPLTETLPHHGCVLMLGKDFQQLDVANKQVWRDWALLSGHSLLLLPPYSAGVIDESLDWQVRFSEPVSSLNGPLAQLLEPEVTQELVGRQGNSDRIMGHYWGTSAFNTRYVKHHAASGVFAATCLPLWSISLLDEAELLLEWLAFFERLAGTSNAIETVSDDLQIQLETIDYSIMACIYAWSVTSAAELMSYQVRQPFPIFHFLPAEMDAGFARLLSGEYIDANGLTSEGDEALKDSAYWLYAEQLKEPSA